LILTLVVPVLTVKDLELVHIFATQIMLVCSAGIVTTIEREAERRARPAQSSAPVAHEEPIEQRLAA
jgi:hypothetical protein